MADFLNGFLKESLEDFEKLEKTEEYKTLITRKEKLTKQKDSLVDEIYDYREFPSKVDNLIKVKGQLDLSIDELDKEIMKSRQSVSDLAKLKLGIKAVQDPFDEFLGYGKTEKDKKSEKNDKEQK